MQPSLLAGRQKQDMTERLVNGFNRWLISCFHKPFHNAWQPCVNSISLKSDIKMNEKWQLPCYYNHCVLFVIAVNVAFVSR